MQLSDHYLALGMTTIYLGSKWDATLDWSKCVDVEGGGTHRLEMSTSVRFLFRDKGLEASWYLELEDRTSNGHGHYQIDLPAIQKVLPLLPPGIRAKLNVMLLEGADKIEKSAVEYQAIAAREYGTVAALRSLARE
jgi:hypothetical protein